MPVENNETLRLLKSLHIFSRLNDELLLRLISAASQVSVKSGETVVEQGGSQAGFCIILSGEAYVLHSRGGEEIQVARLVSGDYFGVEEYLSGRSSPVSIQAASPMRLLQIPYDVFHAFLQNQPQVINGLRLALVTRRMLRGISINWLRPGEEVYFLGRRHKFFLYRSLIVPLILTGLGFGGLIMLYGLSVDSLLAYIGAGGLGGVALVWTGWNILDWSNDHFLVTSQRVVWLERVAGVYDSRQEAPLGTLLSVGVQTGQAGRILGYGDVNVRTYTGSIIFKHVPHPDDVAALIEEHWFRARSASQQEEVQAMGQAIRQRLGVSDPGEGEPAPAEEQPAVEPFIEPGTVTRAFSSLFRMRYEEGPVITYRKHWFVLIRTTWKPFAWCLAGAVLAGARLGGLINFLSLKAFLVVDGIFFLAMFLWYLYRYLDWHNDIYQVTPDQIVDLDKKPFGREEKRAAPIDNILSIQYERLGLVGIIFNFGTVTINVGIAQFTFDYVFNPQQVQKDLFNRMEERAALKKREELRAERERVSDWFATYDEITRKPPEQPQSDGDEGEGFIDEPENKQFWG